MVACYSSVLYFTVKVFVHAYGDMSHLEPG